MNRVHKFIASLVAVPWALTLLMGMASDAFAEAPSPRQMQLFANNCLQCHAAPHISDATIG